jgi:hypothetical protein
MLELNILQWSVRKRVMEIKPSLEILRWKEGDRGGEKRLETGAGLTFLRGV